MITKVDEIPQPVEHFYRAFSHATCPMCSKILTSLFDSTEYMDGRSSKVKSVTRTFNPCGCKAKWEPDDL